MPTFQEPDASRGPETDTGTTTTEQRRNGLIREKLEIQSKTRELKHTIDRGRFAAPQVVQKWEDQLRAMKEKAQALQLEIGKLSRELKTARTKETAEIFLEIARAKLPPDTFHALLRAALEQVEGGR